jgi:hypothetical protein
VIVDSPPLRSVSDALHALISQSTASSRQRIG